MRHPLAAVLFATLTACALPGTGAGAVPGAIEPLDAEALRGTLTELIATHPTAKRTNVALKVTDLETGEVLFDQNSDKLFTPASNLKIYTSAAALDLLGPEYRWTTRVLTGDLVDDGRMTEGFYIEGGGDPMLDTDALESIATQLLSLPDMQSIEPYGEFAIAVRRGWEKLPLKGPGWMWDDDPDYYNMSIQPLMLNFNVSKFIASPGESVGDAIRVEVSPKTYINPKNTGKMKYISPYHFFAGKTSPKQESSFSIDRYPFSADFFAQGAMPVGSKPKTFELTVHDPSDWIRSVFLNMLVDRSANFESPPSDRVYFVDTLVEGIGPLLSGTSSGGGGVVSRGEQERVLVEHQGKTNAEAVKHFLKVSENAVGEMLLLTLSEKFGAGDKVSWPSGAKVISDWLINAAGLEDGSFRLVDGSGLSRYNLISADSSIRLLTYMKNESEHFEPFFDGLPIYKVALPEDDGIKWDGVPMAEFDDERVFAKPGGMSGVSTISGYVQTLDGRWLAFSLLGNGYIGSAAPVRDLRNQVWAELVRYQPAEVAVPSE